MQNCLFYKETCCVLDQKYSVLHVYVWNCCNVYYIILLVELCDTQHVHVYVTEKDLKKCTINAGGRAIFFSSVATLSKLVLGIGIAETFVGASIDYMTAPIASHGLFNLQLDGELTSMQPSVQTLSCLPLELITIELYYSGRIVIMLLSNSTCVQHHY